MKLMAALNQSVLALILGVAAGSAARAEFTDTFSSGTDAGWTHYDPLGGFGAPVSYSFPAGGYRISPAGSPLPGLIGPGRGGSFRTDCTVSDFILSYDLVAWGTTPSFAGAFARVSSPGLATTQGYALGFDFSFNSLFISRVRSENVEAVVAETLVGPLDPSHQYRLTYSGGGANLAGSLQDLTTGTVLATVAGTDTAFASGIVGLGVVVQSTAMGVGATATFDNFSVTVPEPSTWALLVTGLVGFGWITRRRIR